MILLQTATFLCQQRVFVALAKGHPPNVRTIRQTRPFPKMSVLIGAAETRQLLAEVNSAIDVDLLTDDSPQYLVIKVRPCPNPLSYRGKFFMRSGATNRELTGNALDEFMLRKAAPGTVGQYSMWM